MGVHGSDEGKGEVKLKKKVMGELAMRLRESLHNNSSELECGECDQPRCNRKEYTTEVMKK